MHDMGLLPLSGTPTASPLQTLSSFAPGTETVFSWILPSLLVVYLKGTKVSKWIRGLKRIHPSCCNRSILLACICYLIVLSNLIRVRWPFLLLL